MRFSLVLMLAVPAFAQDGPKATTDSARTWTFEFEQAWSLMANTDAAAVGVTAAELIEGVDRPVFESDSFNRTPSTTVPLPPVATTARGQTGTATRTGPGGTSRRPGVNRRRRDPIKAEGRITIDKDIVTVAFDRIEYSDSDQRWWIEFGSKVQIVALVSDKWKGTREEWAARRDECTRILREHWLKCTTPQKRTVKQGIGIQADLDPGRPLFVQTAVEEQLVAMLLARIDGVALRSGWREEFRKEWPERTIDLAGRIVERLAAHARGDLAPSKGKSVKNAEWDLEAPQVPTFAWTASERTSRSHMIEEARKALREISNRSKEKPTTEAAWFDAIEKALATLNFAGEPAMIESPKIADALVPVAIVEAKGRFSYEEKGSKVESSGSVKGMQVKYFDANVNCWRVAEVSVETEWRSSVKQMER